MINLNINQNRSHNGTASGPSALPSTDRRRRILFVGEGVSLAHVVRPLILAGHLGETDYEIGFASSETHRDIAEQEGLAFFALPTLSPETFRNRLAAARPLYDRVTLSECVSADGALLAHIKPDLVISDFRVSMRIATECAGVPQATLCNAYWSPYSTQRFPAPEIPGVGRLRGALMRAVLPLIVPSIFRAHAKAYNEARMEAGLPSVRDIRSMYTGGTWTLFLDLQELAPTKNAPGHCRYLGPVTWSPPVQGFKPLTLGTDPLVYATLGSSGDTAVLPALLQALGTLPVRVALATAGRALSCRIPPNVTVSTFLPAAELLPQAAVCVCNGGAGTGYQALENGVPVLALPANADQFFFSEGLVRSGSGLPVRPSRATPSSLQAALRLLLEDPAYRTAARRLQSQCAASDTAARFRAFVHEALALNEPPIRTLNRHSINAVDTRSRSTLGPAGRRIAWPTHSKLAGTSGARLEHNPNLPSDT